MAELLLFHHVQGLTPGVLAFADDLRAAGHTVHTPDLFAGRTFATLDEGMAHAREVGFGTLLERGVQAAEGHAAGLVYAGFSMGVMPAQCLAQTRPGARGAVLLHACMPTAEFGTDWPVGVPVQIHAMDHDPFFVDGGDLDAAWALVAQAQSTQPQGVQAELFLYPGQAHLFTDRSLPDYDSGAAARLLGRVLTLLQDLE